MLANSLSQGLPVRSQEKVSEIQAGWKGLHFNISKYKSLSNALNNSGALGEAQPSPKLSHFG